MTKSQREEHCNFYILICKDPERVFVIPENSDILTFDRQVLYINISDSRLAQYENAYHLIKEQVLDDIQNSTPIWPLTVFSGQRYYKVSR